MAVTITDIANRLGITPSTVSRALRNDPRVTVTRRLEIKKLAKELGYRPNLVARSLVQGKTQTIGCLFGASHWEIGWAKLNALVAAAEKAGYQLNVSMTDGDASRIHETAIKQLARRVDGLVFVQVDLSLDAEEIRTMGFDFSVPTVYQNTIPFPVMCPQVNLDFRSGYGKAIEHLYENGHRHVCIVPSADEKALDITYAAVYGFFHDLRHNDGLVETDAAYPLDVIELDGGLKASPQDVVALTKAFLARHPSCTAILAHDDRIAQMMISALTRLGVRVPQDLSVVGYNNVPLATLGNPTLSTVAQPVEKMAKVTVDLLLEGIKNGPVEHSQVVIPSEFIARESTGPARTQPLRRDVFA